MCYLSCISGKFLCLVGRNLIQILLGTDRLFPSSLSRFPRPEALDGVGVYGGKA